MLDYFEPVTLQEAIKIAAACGPNGRLLAGGTDLVIQMRRQSVAPSALINIQRIDALRSILIDRDIITVGALVTHSQIEQHLLFHGPLVGLIESAKVIGGRQVRNIATVGGNICNASPAADIIPILLALDAKVQIASPKGERTESLSEFLRGPRQTSRTFDEIVTSVSFERPKSKCATAFLKAGRRRAMEISIASAAAYLAVGKDDVIEDVRIALGAVGPTAFRLADVENLLRGARLEKKLLQEAQKMAVGAATPINDVRASADFRRHLVGVYLARVLQICADRIREIYND